MNDTSMTVAATDTGSPDFSRQQLSPLQPNDDLSFGELQQSYNFRNVSDRRRVFSNLIVNELKSKQNPVVLDIGCGCGMARENTWQWAIKPHVGEYWGIEPDPGVKPAEGLFDHTQNALMETADLPDNSVDLAYSWMVMEHVADPEAFCGRLYKALKPGGSYFFSTPNIKHYFTFVARFLKQLRIDETVLGMIRKQDDLDEYHYPVQYKFNSQHAVGEVCQKVGFNKPEFIYVEVDGPRNYFPGPTKLMFHALAWKRTKIRQPEVLLTMIGRVTKPESA